ncbi:MAG: C25 family cysteine peptidase [Sphingobacteriales bacterium JAD_PAG50586_3]|nr:MAG: C25 family cysteine peptidase [Sphingobacteriales bacterium JAD_PAG50586_3]
MATPEDKNDYKLTVVSPTYGQTVLRFDMTGYTPKGVQTNYGPAYVIEMKGAYPMLMKGMPDLPQITAPIVIPNTGNTAVTVTNIQYTDVANMEIAPSKGNLMRTANPADVDYWKGSSYADNAFIPGKQAELDEPYVFRDYRGQALHIRPFQYNPVTKVLRVITSITVTVNSTTGVGVNEQTSPITHPDSEFSALYKRHFVNLVTEKSTPVVETGSLLIISDPAFMPAMQPYIKWKIRKGIPTEMVSVATIGNTDAAIKTYITNYYNTHNLSYVLLVGDLAQVTSPVKSGGKSDPSYGYLVGTDSYSEIIIGRFSAENIPHVNTQVAKVLKYEIDPPTGNTRFDHQTIIASNEGPGDNNEMDWEHARVIRNNLGTFTYVDYGEFYDETHPGVGNDAAGNPSSANIISEVNTGTGIINYTGHGSATSWSTSGFSNSNIGSLNNTIWPFVWSVGCVNGEFDNGTCFGEAWMRATNNGTPTGAIAAYMSSINQSWSPPMAGQDGMVDILRGTIPNSTGHTFGAISTNGCIYMNDVYGQAGAEMTDTWHCFGDPTVMVRTADPAVLTASHIPTTPIGTSAIAITCNTDGALVALTQNNTILGKAYVNGGIANVTITPVSATDSIFVTATAFNTAPYLGHVLVTANAGPYVVLNGNQLIDNNPGNNNGQADFAEGIGMNISLNNVGDLATGLVDVKLRTTNPNVTLSDSIFTVNTIQPNIATPLSPAFAFNVLGTVADQTLANFSMQMTSGSNTWTANTSVMLNAPVLSVPTFSINDAAGNNNGRIDAGETVDIEFGNLNNGHSATVAATGSLLCSGGMVTLNNTTDNLGIMQVAGTANGTFNLTTDPTTPQNHYVTFNYTVDAAGYTANRTQVVKVNMLVDDLESGGYNTFNWTLAGDVPWTIDNSIKYEGDYSSRSGTITDAQTSTMQLTLDVTQNDSIAFFRKTSCEQDWDFLKFYIDDIEFDAWSGVYNWGRVSYPISTGVHTFRWDYTKDEYYSENDDAVWVDFIELPANKVITSVNEQKPQGSLSVYPNPANGDIALLVDTKTGKAATLQLYNSVGQVVLTETIPAGQKLYNTNVNGFAAGLYTIVIRSENTMLTERLVVK